MHSDMVSSLTGDKSSEMTDDERIGGLQRHIKELKQHLKATFDENCETGYMLKFDLLDHVINDLERFLCLYVLHTLLFERSEVHIMRAYSTTPQRQISVIGKQLVSWLSECKR